MRKAMKRIIAIALATIMMMAVCAFAAYAAEDNAPSGSAPRASITITPNAPADTTQDDQPTITYTYYKILSADVLSTNQNDTGTVSYYVESEAQANALTGTGLFTVSRVKGENKWNVKLTSKNTNADAIVNAFNDDGFLSNFEQKTYTSQGGDAVLPGVSTGYYFIKSSLGSKMAVQTLGNVNITEKNEYVTDNKTIPEGDVHSQIGQEIVYTLTVNVPTTASEEIVLTDTMGVGLTFNKVRTQTPITGAVSGLQTNTDGTTKFTITYTADQIKALVAGKDEAQVITVEVATTLNGQAVIDTDIPNTLDLKYGNNYDAKPVTVNTQTTKFDFDKIDGADTTKMLEGAEFQFTRGGTALSLVEEEKGKTYRIANGETGTVDTIVTNGNTVTIKGLDGDATDYQLVETKAPTGYNQLEEPIDVKANDHKFAHQNVENYQGSQLPSTGGMGTTIFYVIGGILVLAAAIILISKRRVQQ